MAKGQFTGIRGVFLVASELTKRGFHALPTVRNTKGFDLLVAGSSRVTKAEVKTNNFPEGTSDARLTSSRNLRVRKGACPRQPCGYCGKGLLRTVAINSVRPSSELL